MGGFGSGRHWYSKATTSDYDRLDVRHWQREGLLVASRSFFGWPWDIEVVASVKRDEPNMVWLYRGNRADQRRTPCRVSLDWTRCNYGGKRAWFVCPRGCGHRVAILYGESDLACRHCRRLSYDSQQDSGWHRSLRQARTARMRLGGSSSLADPFPGKPKGMHWDTYRRLYSQAAAHEQVFLGDAVTMITSLKSRFHGRAQWQRNLARRNLTSYRR
jgi:hypothetical protein